MVIIIVHVTQHVKSIKNFDLLPKKINKTIQIEVKTGLYNWSCIIRKKKGNGNGNGNGNRRIRSIMGYS